MALSATDHAPERKPLSVSPEVDFRREPTAPIPERRIGIALFYFLVSLDSVPFLSFFIVGRASSSGPAGRHRRAVHVELFPVNFVFEVKFFLKPIDDPIERAILGPRPKPVIHGLPFAVSIG